MIIAILDEVTLCRLPWWLLRRRAVHILEVRARFRPLTGAMTRIASMLDRLGLTADATAAFPALAAYREAAAPELTLDIFRKTEPWFNEHFQFASRESTLGDYGYAFKHASCSFIRIRLLLPILIHEVLKNRESESIQFAGFDRDTIGLTGAFYGSDMTPRFEAIPGKYLGRLINACQFMGSMAATLFYILARMRIAVPSREEIQMGTDFVGDPRDMPIYENCAKVGQIMLVARNKSVRKSHDGKMPDYRFISEADGAFTIAAGLKAFVQAVRDATLIHAECRDLAQQHYLAMVRLTHKRVVYRALFNKYKFRYFWCRDDYNSEHIIRSQELRRDNSVSMGVNHGYPILAIIVPHYRYIDYDIYFTFGPHLHERYYRDTWPAQMKVRCAGSLGMTTAHQERSKAARPNNILIFLKIGYWLEEQNEMLEALVTQVAQAFRDRKIFVKFKSTRRSPQAIADMVDRWQTANDNIVVPDADEDSYELLYSGSYVITDPSSIVAEAIHFGLTSFVIDFDNWESLLFRDFPALCVSGAEEAIDRIRKVESGEWIYPRESFEPLIALSSKPLADQVRDIVANKCA